MKNRTNVKTLNMIQYALMIAMVFVTTYLIQIPMPWSQGGLIHIGDIILFTLALVFGKRKGAIAGGFGMFLFDFFSPYKVWAPFTLVIRFTMGYVVGYISHSKGKNGENNKLNIIAVLASLPILIIGYYIAEIIIYGNWIAPLNSIPGNLWQFAFGIIGAIPLSASLNRIQYIKYIKSLDN